MGKKFTAKGGAKHFISMAFVSLETERHIYMGGSKFLMVETLYHSA